MGDGPGLVCPGCGSPDVDLRRGLLCGTCATLACPCPCPCPRPGERDDDGTPGWCLPCRMEIHMEAQR